MMWWPWKKRHPTKIGPPLEEQRKIREAREAVVAADELLEQTKRQGVEVRRVSNLLRQLREDNNFGALVHRSMLRR
jgi:hypothetical protein